MTRGSINKKINSDNFLDKDLHFVVNKKGELIKVSDLLCKKVGCAQEDILGMTLEDTKLLTKEGRKSIMLRKASRLIGKDNPFYNLEIKTTDNNVLFLDIETKPYIKNRKNIGEIGLVKKITSETSNKKNQSDKKFILSNKVKNNKKDYFKSDFINKKDVHNMNDKSQTKRLELEEKDHKIRKLQAEIKAREQQLSKKNSELEEAHQNLHNNKYNVEEKNLEMKRLHSDIQEKEKRLKSKYGEINSITKEMRNAQSEIENMNNKINNIMPKLNQRQKEVLLKNDELKKVKSKLENSTLDLEKKGNELHSINEDLEQKESTIKNIEETTCRKKCKGIKKRKYRSPSSRIFSRATKGIRFKK